MRRIIDATPDLRVVGSASNGRIGLESIAEADPDVVLLDIEMPELDGLATLPRLLAAHPHVRVIMASSLTQKGAQVTLEALAIGAADYITKPTSRAGPDALAPMAEQVVAKIRGLGRARRGGVITTEPRSAPRPQTPSYGTPTFRPSAEPAPSFANRVHREPTRKPAVIAIASSTGGPNALVNLLRGLPNDFRTPIIITQHMPPLFTLLLAQRLQRETGRPCVEATDRMPLAEGHVFIAPGDYHLIVEPAGDGWRLRLTQSAQENHCRPAADPMFRSVAEHFGSRALALVLTGMGEDGRRGSQAIRNAGGHVFAQDEATSVVWGMPGAVVAAGCADAVLPIDQLSQRVALLEQGTLR